MRVNVALPIALPPLTYQFPPDFGQPKLGMAVEVSLRRKKLTGYIVELDVREQGFIVKPISSVQTNWPMLDSSYVEFLQWAAEYYHYPLGEALETALPAKMILKKEPQFLPAGLALGTQHRHELSGAQLEVCREVRDAIDRRRYAGFLLKGVTGSGKTEVYLSLAEYVLALGSSVMIMVPEISLTPQLVSRFRARLGDKIAVMHSGLTERARSDQWHLLHRGEARVVIGARSTIFAPIKNLGLIIIDEEHEGAFKQEDRFRYHARDLALLRAKHEEITVLLGSATPSLESWHNVHSGKLRLLELPDRITGSALPAVELIDLKRVSPGGIITPRLRFCINETLEIKKQVMLFLNRRGHASFIVCKPCGKVPQCPNCSVSLTYYRHKPELRCHYCNYTEESYTACKQCGESELNLGTLGTESLEEEVKGLFPQAHVLRMDTESLSQKGELEKALLMIAEGAVDIIVGTQMIAKGHDFPGVHLVAVVNADSSTNFPDFRASERSFQLFTQVAGRAGRSQSRGKVIIQSFNPEHAAVRFAVEHDYMSFASQELAIREMFHYPPYYRLARVLISDASEFKARSLAQKVSQSLLKRAIPGLDVLGPAPALLQKLKNKHRYNLLLKCREATLLNRVLKQELTFWREHAPSSSTLQIDVDPLSLL